MPWVPGGLLMMVIFWCTMISNTYAKKMKANGGQVYPLPRLRIWKKSGNKLPVLKQQSSYDFDVVVDASGAWTRYTSRMAGLNCRSGTPRQKSHSGANLSRSYPTPSRFWNTHASTRGEKAIMCLSAKRIWRWTWTIRCTPVSGIPINWPRLVEQMTISSNSCLVSWMSTFLVCWFWFAQFLAGYRAEPPDFQPILGDTR